MTRVASSLNKLIIKARVEEPERLWFFREAHDLAPNIVAHWTSDIIPDGSVIHRVAMMIGIEPGGKPEGMHVAVFLTSRERFTIAEAMLEEQIIWFTERNTDVGYYPMCDDCEEQFPMRKVVRGSDRRFGIIVGNITNKIASVRVGILHSIP